MHDRICQRAAELVEQAYQRGYRNGVEEGQRRAQINAFADLTAQTVGKNAHTSMQQLLEDPHA